MATLDFKGKQIIRNYHLTLKYHSLNGIKKKSKTDKISLNDNLIIHGDNLLALKALLPTYAGKIKCIYIDPPYNTGNEGWKYNDNVNSPMTQDWLHKTVDKDDLTRHDKWLCMMMPRLKLLRELLRDDGGLFISIDYNEEAHLRMLLDEIFGEDNYRNTFVIARVKKNIQEREKVRSVNFGFDSLLFYAKSEACLINPPHKYQLKNQRWHAFDAPGIRPSMEYELFGKKPPKGRHWMFDLKRANDLIAKGELQQNSTTGSVQYSLKASNYTLLDTNWTDIQEYASNWNFPYGEKNIELIKRTIKMLDEPNMIVLDSFAGSGTTGHTVLDLNKWDGGNRKFIMIECEDYADNITAERIRRVIAGIPESKDKDLRKGLGGTFSYYELGKPLEVTKILEGKDLPDYKELARYVFYTATGDQIDEGKINPEKYYIGESKDYFVYLLYQPELDYLKSKALPLDIAKSLGDYKGKKRLIFAPTKYMDAQQLLENHIEFAQLPFEIYKMAK